MADDGTSFSIDIEAPAGNAEAAAVSVARLAEKLTGAGAAAVQAAEAVRSGEAAYKQAENSAVKAATALEKIGLQADAQRGKLQAALDTGDTGAIDRATAKLASLTARQAEAAAKAASTAAAMNAEAASLDKLKASAAAAADVEAGLVKQQTNLAASAAKTSKADKEQADAQAKSVGAAGMLEGAFAKLGGPLGAVGQKAAGVGGAILKMGKSLGAAGPYVAAAVLALAVTVAFVGAAAAITKFAIASADTARTQALLSDGVAGSVAGGRELDKTLAGLANTVPIARDELMGMASELAKTGLKGADLSTALEEAATKAATLKFGPNFGKQMLSLDNQAARLKRGITAVFSGLKIEAFLEALSKVTSLFDANSASANALKTVFESLFQPIVDGLTGLLPKAISTFIQIEIAVMKAMIAIKPWGSTLAYIGVAFAILAAVAVAAIAVIIVILLALIALPALLVAGFMWIGDASEALGVSIRVGAGAALDWLRGKFDEVVAFLTGLSLAQIGSDLITGLVNGIMAAGPAVLTAITGLATGAITAAKKALGIASPSTIFAEIGMHTAAGMEEGVDGGADAVQGSMKELVAPPDAAAAGGGAKVSASGGGNVFNITINGAGGDGASIAASVREAITDLLTQAGGSVPSAA